MNTASEKYGISKRGVKFTQSKLFAACLLGILQSEMDTPLKNHEPLDMAARALCNDKLTRLERDALIQQNLDLIRSTVENGLRMIPEYLVMIEEGRKEQAELARQYATGPAAL
jgi:hypothetical protein